MSTPITECFNSYGNYDPIPATLLKLFSTFISPTTYNRDSIVNLSLFTGTFLSLLTFSIVSPLLKELTIDNEYLTNYHPISNHFIIYKIPEVDFHLCILQYIKPGGTLNYIQINLSQILYRYCKTKTLTLRPIGMTDGWTGGRVNGRTDGRAGGWTGGRTGGRTDEWVNGKTDGWTGRRNDEREDTRGRAKAKSSDWNGRYWKWVGELVNFPEDEWSLTKDRNKARFRRTEPHGGRMTEELKVSNKILIKKTWYLSKFRRKLNYTAACTFLFYNALFFTRCIATRYGLDVINRRALIHLCKFTFWEF